MSVSSVLFFPPFPRFSSIGKEIDECIRDVRNGGFIIFAREKLRLFLKFEFEYEFEYEF